MKDIIKMSVVKKVLFFSKNIRYLAKTSTFFFFFY